MTRKRRLTFWERGQRRLLAELAGIHENNLYEILNRRRGVSKAMALRLETASEKLLGYPIPWDEWLFNEATKHPAFYGEPKE